MGQMLSVPTNWFIVSWKLALPSFAPVPAVLVTAYLNIALLEKYEHSVQAPLQEASAFASENVDAIKVCTQAGFDQFITEKRSSRPLLHWAGRAL